MKDARRTVLLVVDGRASAIAMAPLYCALLCHPWFEPALVNVAGDREDVARQALAAFAIVPEYDLDLPGAADGPGAWAASRAVDRLLALARPALLVTRGASPATALLSLAAVQRGLAVAWLEGSPGDGEGDPGTPRADGTRPLAARLASLVVTTDSGTRAAWLAEGLAPERVIAAGSLARDALALVACRRERATPGLAPPGTGPLLLVALADATTPAVHEGVATALSEVLSRRRDLRVAWPFRRDPLTAAPCERRLARPANVRLAPPLRYDRFIATLATADLVLTNSAMIAEEAATLGRPLLVVGGAGRRPTAPGDGQRVAAIPAAIASALSSLLAQPAARRARAGTPDPRGGERATTRLLAGLEALARAQVLRAA